MTGHEVWASFALDPRSAAHATLRASDADREIVRQVLSDGYADGRLDREELDERSDRAAAARTLGELPPVIVDLVPEAGPRRAGSELVRATPSELRTRAEASYSVQRRQALLRFASTSILMWAIWLASGLSGDGPFATHYFWPIYVMLGVGLPAVRVLTHRQAMVDDEVRKLEKKRDRALRQPPDGQAPR